MDRIQAENFKELLAAYRDGDDGAAAELFALVYQDLRLIARQLMRRERQGHTLQTTALVHEIYLRLFGENQIEWQDGEHFFIVAARQMRRILVDHSRRVHAKRRAGDQVKLSLEELVENPEFLDGQLVHLDEALLDLERNFPRACRVVELRYFAGMTEPEVSLALGISVASVKRDWKLAKAWLLSELTGDDQELNK
jgi:RNA polymerase sigma-70 factor (ECF subfamily)